MASSRIWEKRLRPKFSIAVTHTAKLIEDGTILDILLSKNVLTSCQYKKRRSSNPQEAARALLLDLQIGTKFDTFLAILPDVEGAEDLLSELTDGQAPSRSDSDSDSESECDSDRDEKEGRTILTVSVLKKYERVYKKHRHSFRSTIKKAFLKVYHKRVKVDETYPKKLYRSDSGIAITDTVVFRIVFPNLRNRRLFEPHRQSIVRELAGVMRIPEDQVEIVVSDGSCILSITVPGNGFICFVAALEAPSNIAFLFTVDDNVIVRIDGPDGLFEIYGSTRALGKPLFCKALDFNSESDHCYLPFSLLVFVKNRCFQLSTSRLIAAVDDAHYCLDDVQEKLRNITTKVNGTEEYDRRKVNSLQNKTKELELQIFNLESRCATIKKMRDTVKERQTILRMKIGFLRETRVKVKQNRARRLLEKLAKMALKDVPMTYTGLSDILAETKMSFFYYLRKVQSNLVKNYEKRSINAEIEFIFCLDNSGSMGGMKCRFALSALVLAMEVLNKLESRFAVMRFGGKETQERGEFIFEAMDNKEKSCPLDALNWVINSPDGFDQFSNDSKLRAIVFLTDGFSEMDSNLYRRNFKDVKVGIQIIIVNFRTFSLADYLHIYERAESKRQRKVDDACEDISNFCVHVNPNDLSAVAPKLAEVMTKVMTDHLISRRSCLPAIRKKEVEFGVQEMSLAFNFQIASAFLSEAIKDLAPERRGKPLVLLRERYASRLVHPDTSDVKATDDLTANENFKEELQALLEDRFCTLPAGFRQLPAVWREITKNFSATIKELENVFCELLYPLSLSSDFFPSLLKLMQTNCTYQRIFRLRAPEEHSLIQKDNTRQLTFGDRERRAKYDVCFLFDVSNSVQGSCLRSSLLAIIAMATALDNCEIESFSILSYSSKVTLIKDFSEKWGDVCVLRLLAAASSTLPESRDADGIHIAVDYFLASDSSNPKILFVFTDGFGSSGDRLQDEIKRAALAGVDVVGVGLGVVQTAVDKAYYSYVTAATVAHLPGALRNLFSSSPFEAPYLYEQESTATGIKPISSKAQVFIKHTIGFSAVMKLDICYVIDGTGSMFSYIHEAKTWIVELTRDICKTLEECGRQGDVKVACVIYRSSCCSTSYVNRPDIFDFDFAENLSQRIHSVECRGGCGSAADVMGGIEWALNLTGWRSNAVQFLIEMGDECPHGAYWNLSPCKDDVSAAKIEKDKSLIQSIRERKMKFILSTVVPGLRDRFRKRFKEFYDFPTQGLELQELDFCGSSTGVQIVSPGVEFKKITLKLILSDIL